MVSGVVVVVVVVVFLVVVVCFLVVVVVVVGSAVVLVVVVDVVVLLSELPLSLSHALNDSTHTAAKTIANNFFIKFLPSTFSDIVSSKNAL